MSTYDEATRAAVHRVIADRREVLGGLRPDPVPDEVVTRVLAAAHDAPTVGPAQPWDFIVIKSPATRERVRELFLGQREHPAGAVPVPWGVTDLAPDAAEIVETPLNIAVTSDPTRGAPRGSDPRAQQRSAVYSTCLAVENLWLAARAEGLGIAWVGVDKAVALARALALPEHVDLVAYLCLGYVAPAVPDPEPQLAPRRPLGWVVHHETYGQRSLPGEEPTSVLDETRRAIRPPDLAAAAAAQDRLEMMAGEGGTLGTLEDLCIQLAGLAGHCPPPVPEPAAVAVFAADHGVHGRGVSLSPQEATADRVRTCLTDRSVVNAVAAQVRAEVCVVDVGISADIEARSGMLPRKVRRATADMTTEPAMTPAEARRAAEVGIEVARDLVSTGCRCLLTGSVGVADSVATAALIATFTGADPAEVVGSGARADDTTRARVIETARQAIDRHRPDPAAPFEALAAVGGLEHAALVGLLLSAAALHVPVVLDSGSAAAAALVAAAVEPDAVYAWVAGQRSGERGQAFAFRRLSLQPLVDVGVRLGEGTGAALALPILQGAVRAMREVATIGYDRVAHQQA
jgi:nicotinate-nucleotide--dimethylbenzimidazole phosphoribosyltransferase